MLSYPSAECEGPATVREVALPWHVRVDIGPSGSGATRIVFSPVVPLQDVVVDLSLPPARGNQPFRTTARVRLNAFTGKASRE